MEAKLGPATGRQGPSRGLLWGLIVAIVVLAAAGIAAVVVLWPAEERATVPDLVDMNTDAAQRVLEAAGLELGDVERVTVAAETAEADTVISQAPSAGPEVDDGSQVAVIATDVAEEAGEDEAETPPAASGGGSESSGGGGAEPEPTPTWHKMLSASDESGPGDHVSSPFDAVTQQHKLEVTVSSDSGGQFTFAIIQIEPASMQPWFSRDLAGQPAATRHSYLVDLVVGRKYHVAVVPPADGLFSYTLYDYRP